MPKPETRRIPKGRANPSRRADSTPRGGAPSGRWKVVLTHPIHPAVMRERLARHARMVLATTPARLRRELRDADALLTLLSHRVDERLLASAPRLRVVGNYAAGLDNIDLAACARRGVKVVHTPRVLSRATAELALALLLAAARRVPEGEALCRRGAFRGWAPDLLLGRELRGKTALLLGRGRIGRETARLFRAVGLRIEWITRADSRAAIDRKLARADVLSLHCPLTAETHHWLDARRLGRLPRHAIVINTARGPVVDEAALIRALRSRRIFAAGLDVFEREPFIPPALRRLPNAVLLPHLGSATDETRRAMAELLVRGALQVLGGQRPANLVKPRASS